MHPAPSVIIFTTLSGLGFGLFAFLGLGLPDVSGWVAFVFFAMAYALSCAGLLASTFHLGNPRNAIYAFSQWRSSWLSREGIINLNYQEPRPFFHDLTILPIPKAYLLVNYLTYLSVHFHLVVALRVLFHLQVIPKRIFYN